MRHAYRNGVDSLTAEIERRWPGQVIMIESAAVLEIEAPADLAPEIDAWIRERLEPLREGAT